MVKEMLSYSGSSGYRRTKPVRRTDLVGFTGIIDTILESGLSLAASQYGNPADGLSKRAYLPYLTDSSGCSLQRTSRTRQGRSRVDQKGSVRIHDRTSSAHA